MGSKWSKPMNVVSQESPALWRSQFINSVRGFRPVTTWKLLTSCLTGLTLLISSNCQPPKHWNKVKKKTTNKNQKISNVLFSFNKTLSSSAKRISKERNRKWNNKRKRNGTVLLEATLIFLLNCGDHRHPPFATKEGLSLNPFMVLPC